MAFGLFKRKKKEVKESRYLKLTIREVVPIAKDTVNLVFEKPEVTFEYQPGQFITLIDQIGGHKIRRAYSLCSTPFLDEYPAVTVKRVEGGQMSNQICNTYKPGDQIDVMEPLGMFTIDFDEKASRKAVFIGGGSGITPLISLIRSILFKEPMSEVALIYGNRKEEYIIFKDLLNDLAKKHPSRFKLINLLEEDPNGIANQIGRPSPAMIGNLVTTIGYAGAEYYICGPQPMMDVTVEGLKLAGVRKEAIRMESFEVGKTTPKEVIISKDSGKASQVTIILDGEEYLVPVPMDRRILETALDAGLDMPYSCQSGLCTACRGMCVEGEITTDDAEGLSAEEMEEGYRLLCVGKPATSEIRIEIG